jgi:hypothetical protein
MLRRLAHGDRLIVECSDPLAVIDIPHLLAIRWSARGERPLYIPYQTRKSMREAIYRGRC